MKFSLVALELILGSTFLVAQTPPGTGNPLARRYREGESLTYRMAAVNDGWNYTADATGIARKNTQGVYFVGFRWTQMTSNGRAVALASSMAEFCEPLSLDPRWTPSMPDLSKVDPKMVGPITDLMTFYVDLWLANKIGILKHPGDHFYVPNPQPSSWANGTDVLIGESLIDFDLNLQSIDAVKHTALLVVRHVPSPHSNLHFPATWMLTPAADTPNNWIEVSKTRDGKYEAGTGKETFDDLITVSTIDGKILSATMDNLVVVSERLCADAALNRCGDAKPHTIHRQIKIALAP